MQPDAPPKPTETATTSAATDTPIQSLGRNAAGAAASARDAVQQALSAPMPDVNLYTEPLNPGASLTLHDRLQLVLESCRPWGEFADFKSLNAPAASELKLRLAHNLEIFFYNYLVIGLAILALTALFHPLRALCIALVVFVAVLMYIVFPEDYHITDSFYVTRPVKHVVVGLLCVLLLTVGHVLSMLFFFFSFFLPLTLIHAFLREHSAATMSSI